MKHFITRAYGATKLLLHANAPTLMVGGGVVAMGVGTVLACKQTLKIEEVLENHIPDLEKIQTGLDLGLDSYSDDIARTDRIKVYSRVGLDMTKLYAVPGILFVSGAGLVFGGHRIMLKRNATLAIAFTTVSKAFDAYRFRVVNQLGSEADQALMSGHVSKEVWDDEQGKNVKVHTRDWEGYPNGDPYNRVFEQGATSEWTPDLGTNKLLIHNQQRMANELLSRRGHLYLSEVYEALGFPESDISRVVGWKVRKNPDGSRNIPFVDFGLDKPHPEDWKYNKEKAIYLDFNCEGLIIGGKVQKILEKA